MPQYHRKNYKVNEQIKVETTRVINDEGVQLGIMSRNEALKLAQEQELDLVLIAPSANPPVCKIIDYGKFKYKEKKKRHEAQVKQRVTHLRVIVIGLKTAEHDLQIKARKAREFIEKKDKVQVNMEFRGYRERSHARDVGQQVMRRFAEQLEDIAKMEKPPTIEGRRMNMILAPK